MSVPRLATALAGLLLDLERRLLASQPETECWLRGKWQEHAAPFYCSVDLRNSGFKLAPVDTNLFPGGFNNLNLEFHPLCVQAGWTVRRKSNHFKKAYRQVAGEFAGHIGIDPWLINPLFEKCGKINIQERKGEECLEGYVAEILDDIRAKYREYGIQEEPFVIVKADAGTYGMGIMTVKDPSEVRGLNRRQRTRMAVVKEGLQVHEVMVQEGVYTFESMDDAVAEPVVYMIDHFVVGGFYRVHTQRGKDQNLNAPGMQFAPLAFAAPCSSPNPDDPGCPPNRFYAYGVIARLALLAASIELEAALEGEIPSIAA